MTDENRMEPAKCIEGLADILRGYRSAGVRFVEKIEINPLPSAADGGRGLLMKRFADAIADCKLCKLHKKRNKVVFGGGDPNARILFVGEGPGADEDAQGIPFVGRAGKLMNELLATAGLERSEIYIANIVKCRPPENRNPEPDEVEACIPYLYRQIEILSPDFILLLGLVAMRAILGKKIGSTGSLRGKFIDWRGIRVLPTYHPAYLLRSPSYKKQFLEDLQFLLAAYRK